jgi:hypothetical protein
MGGGHLIGDVRQTWCVPYSVTVVPNINQIVNVLSFFTSLICTSPISDSAPVGNQISDARL